MTTAAIVTGRRADRARVLFVRSVEQLILEICALDWCNNAARVVIVATISLGRIDRREGGGESLAAG